MVQEFLNVFPDSLLSLALKRKVEFSIKLAFRYSAIFKALYKMATTKLNKSKKNNYKSY